MWYENDQYIQRFEVMDFDNISQQKAYITLMHAHQHHYTGEKMRYIRIDYVDIFEETRSEYRFVNEAEWRELLALKIEEY